MIERSRKEVMSNLLKGNIGLVFHKREELQIPYSHFLVTNKVLEHGALSSKTTCYLAPLFLYPTDKEKRKSSHIQMMIFEPEVEYKVRKPNIQPELIEELEDLFNKKVTPEDIFYYIYGVLYSNKYREKYSEFLKMDFPRIPFTTKYNLFIQLSELGKQLSEYHLLSENVLKKIVLKFPVKGSNNVEKISFEKGKIWINKEQYFAGTSEEVWNYYIGGYKVCDKWLSSRKGRTLDYEELLTFQKITVSLSKTIELQKEIDKYYEEVEKSLTGE
jgi:predicted helicase